MFAQRKANYVWGDHKFIVPRLQAINGPSLFLLLYHCLVSLHCPRNTLSHLQNEHPLLLLLLLVALIFPCKNKHIQFYLYKLHNNNITIIKLPNCIALFSFISMLCNFSSTNAGFSSHPPTHKPIQPQSLPHSLLEHSSHQYCSNPSLSSG